MSANPSESDSSKLSHPPLLVDIRIFLVKKVNNSTSIFLVAFKIRVSLKYLVLLPTVLLKTCFLGKKLLYIKTPCTKMAAGLERELCKELWGGGLQNGTQSSIQLSGRKMPSLFFHWYMVPSNTNFSVWPSQ